VNTGSQYHRIKYSWYIVSADGAEVCLFVCRSAAAADGTQFLLEPKQDQPRRYFDERELAALAESIKAEGVRNPLHVRRLADDRYEVLAGERRYRAAVMAELERVPVIVHEIDDATAANLAILDNLHRADLNPIEETEAILLLVQSALGVNREAAVAKVRAAANVAKGRPQEGIDDEELTTLQTLFDRSVGRLTVGCHNGGRARRLSSTGRYSGDHPKSGQMSQP
jgi:ParB/RepB/Spo0J family partition protein